MKQLFSKTFAGKRWKTIIAAGKLILLPSLDYKEMKQLPI